MISTGICKTSEFSDSTFFKAVCGCGSDDHTLTLVLENEDGIISLSIYVETTTAYWKKYSPHLKVRFYERLKDIKFRILTAIKLIFTGRFKSQSDFIFENEQAIRDYTEALLTEVERVKKYVPRT